MKDKSYKKVETDGYQIKVGDIVSSKHSFGGDKYSFTRVTEKFAFAKTNDTYEMKFKRDYKKWGFEPLPKVPYSRVEYSLYSLIHPTT